MRADELTKVRAEGQPHQWWHSLQTRRDDVQSALLRRPSVPRVLQPLPPKLTEDELSRHLHFQAHSENHLIGTVARRSHTCTSYTQPQIGLFYRSIICKLTMDTIATSKAKTMLQEPSCSKIHKVGCFLTREVVTAMGGKESDWASETWVL